MSNRISTQINAYTFASIISSVFSVISAPILTRLINPEEYGKASFYSILFSLITMFSFLGLDHSYMRWYYDVSNKSKLANRIFTLGSVISIIISSIILMFMKKLSFILFESKNTFPVILLSTAILIFPLQRISNLTLRLSNKVKEYSFIIIIGPMLRLILSVLFTWLTRNYIGVILGVFSSFVIQTIIQMRFSDIKYKFSVRYEELKMNSLFRYGIPLVFSGAIFWGLGSIGSIGLKLYSDFNQLGLYTSALKIASAISILGRGIRIAWFPIAFEEYNNNNSSNERLSTISDIVFCGIVFFMALITVLRNFLILFLGSEYHAAALLIPTIIFVPAMTISSDLYSIGLLFKKKTITKMLISLTALITNLLIMPSMIVNHGAFGATVASFISFSIYFWLNFFASNKLYKSTNSATKIVILFSLTVSIMIFAVFEIKLLEYLVFFLIFAFTYKSVIKILKLLRQLLTQVMC